MDIFRQHEVFEIDVLDRMKRSRQLELLVFGGGTMLRLCHELPRYSADLDFWFIKHVSEKDFFKKLRKSFDKDYDITDAQIKHFTLLFELRSAGHPKRLKIEIRRAIQSCDFQEMIAFSPYAEKQVALKAHTLEQTMKNKIAAFLDRGEIRDCFDIEFLLRRGISFPPDIEADADRILTRIDNFKDTDFKVKLGSILEAEYREYYTKQRFTYLKQTLSAHLNR